MPTFMELAYNGNYVKRGIYSFIFTYKGKVYIAFRDGRIGELKQANGVFIN